MKIDSMLGSDLVLGGSVFVALQGLVCLIYAALCLSDGLAQCVFSMFAGIVGWGWFMTYPILLTVEPVTTGSLQQWQHQVKCRSGLMEDTKYLTLTGKLCGCLLQIALRWQRLNSDLDLTKKCDKLASWEIKVCIRYAYIASTKEISELQSGAVITWCIVSEATL